MRNFYNHRAANEAAVLSLDAPSPLPNPFVGDDLRTATITMEVKDAGGATVKLTHTMSELQLDHFSMCARLALAHMRGRRPQPQKMICKTCTQEVDPLKVHVCPGLGLKDDNAFRRGRELLIEGGEKAIDMLASGTFYEDHDASTEALGELRSLLDVVKDTLK